MKRKFISLFAVIVMLLKYASAQIITGSYDSLVVNYDSPKEYTIAGINVVGTQFLDKDILIALSGIRVGDRVEIPGMEVSKAVKNLWKQQLFANVKVYIDST